MVEMNASIITIGDELLIGQTIDTNSAFIAQELNKIGIWIQRRVAVGDNREDILEALEQQSKDCRIIIITGGLGPTDDDITKKVLCEYFNCESRIDKEALENVKNIFSKLNRPLIERNMKQAEVPSACSVLPNSRGTAPGMWFEKDGVIYVSLPGVPNEMKGLMTNSVIPKLQQIELPVVLHRTLLTSGVGESVIADTLVDFEKSLPSHIKLAYLPTYGMVRLRLTTRSNELKKATVELDHFFMQLQTSVGKWMVTDQDISLVAAVNHQLRIRNKTMCTAESCTGGYISHLITSVPGSSEIYKGSVIAYSNELKTKLLRVSSETLQKFGAVSEETVGEMITGALESIHTDYAIATSGIMGPGGGSQEKPAGTVWIAVGDKQNIRTAKLFFRFDRERNIEMTAHAALTMLFRFVNESPGEKTD